MQTLCKVLALLVLGAVVAAPLAGQAVRPDPASHEQPAGCHEDNGKVPSPAPASHSCCLASHHPAILQQASTWRPSLELSAKVESSLDLAGALAIDLLPSFVVVSGGPPVMSPLRV